MSMASEAVQVRHSRTAIVTIPVAQDMCTVERPRSVRESTSFRALSQGAGSANGGDRMRPETRRAKE